MDVTQDLVNEISYLVSSTDWNAIGNELVGYVEDFFNSYGISGADLAPIGMLALMVFMVIAALVACVAVCAIVAAVFTFVAFVVSAVVFFLQEYLLPAIALFKMAKKAGYKYPWFAFIPFAQTYLEFVLPRREFKVLFIKAGVDMRYVVALVFIGVTATGLSAEKVTNYIPVVGGALGVLLAIFIMVLFVGCSWRKMYDLFCTYAPKKTAVTLSVFSLFVPLIYTIALLVYMNKEPDFGAGNYYAVSNKAGFMELNPEVQREAEGKKAEDKS